MITVEKLTADAFPAVFASFLVADDPLLLEDDWRRLFTYQWDNEFDHYGYLLMNGGEVVGMLGTLYSQRIIHGRLRKICNLHSWMVQEAHRGKSLLLMRQVLRLKDYTLTDLTPTPPVVVISRRLGFTDLDAQLTLLLPSPAPAAPRGERRWVISSDRAVLASALNDDEKTIVRHHAEYPCHHVVVSDGTAYCYVVYTLVERHALPYCYIHYVSDKGVFSRASLALRSALMRTTGGRYVAVDARLVRGCRVPLSVQFPLRPQQLYRPAGDMTPEEIDSLYTELLLLRLTTYPKIGKAVRRWLRRSRNRDDVTERARR